MALIDCPECRAEISEHAPACPRCAYPIGGRVPSPLRSTTAPRGAVYSALDVTKQIVGRLALGGMFMASSIAWEAPPVFVGALIVMGSSIPIWIKAKRAERFGASGDARRLEARIDQRLREAEERTLQHIGEIEENARLIADLEERLDFTERLLTRQREQA